MGDPLDRLTIQGFKSIHKLEDFEFKSLNVLIGANGAGKSNLISFFRLLQAIINGNLKDYVRESGGISDLLFNGRKATRHLEFETRFGPRGYRFKIKPGPSEHSWALTDEERYYEHGRTGWWKLGDSPDGQSLLVKEVKARSRDAEYSKPVYESIDSWKIYHFHDTSGSAAMRHSEIIQDNKSLRFDASNIAPFLLRLKNEDEETYEEILQSCRLVIPYFDDFLLDVESSGQKKTVTLSWRAKGSDYPMQPYHFSDGSIRFICLTTALLQPDPPSSLMIDEPELGLHPAAISILAELIQNASKRTQLIVATQSPALIDNFSVEDVVVVSRKDGASTFERLHEKDYRAWLEGYSVGELWSKDVIAGGPVYE
ncbi:MAG: AAA family ATPase [Nitrospira sp. SB0675_bin_23]|nr:AAA family ATPase [Nitrospira sp. SB0675_bin_23]